MRLKEKTHTKFVDYFERMSKMYQGQEFELAYSAIQVETGVASVTLKRAIKELIENKIIEVKPGRNSRYAQFRYIPGHKTAMENQNKESIEANFKVDFTEDFSLEGKNAYANWKKSERAESFQKPELNKRNDVEGLFNLVDHLRRRIRIQEMSLAVLQDRLAELEDKLSKR